MSLSYSIDQQDEEVGFWELRRGDETLAMLEQICSDFPWVECFFFPEPAFEPYRRLFTRAGGHWRGRERELHETIAREGIYLETAGHQRIAAFTLVLNDSGARLTFTQV